MTEGHHLLPLVDSLRKVGTRKWPRNKGEQLSACTPGSDWTSLSLGHTRVERTAQPGTSQNRGARTHTESPASMAEGDEPLPHEVTGLTDMAF